MTLEFRMPKLGESVTEGTIGRWLKSAGEHVQLYEPMLEVTTDKVDTEVSAPIDGTLAEILVGEGETVAVGTIIARLEPADDNVRDGATGAGEAAQGVSAAPPAAEQAGSSFVSPVVARLAAEHGIDLRTITGTGAGGRVTRKDIAAAVASRAEPALGAAPVERAQLQQAFEVGTRGEEPAPAPEEPAPAPPEVAAPEEPTAAPEELTSVALPPSSVLDGNVDLLPISPMRRAIAEHMVRSKRTAPHVTTVMEADLSRVVAHREHNRADSERQGVKLSFTPYFVQAVVAALGEVPRLNSSWGDSGIVQHRQINIGVAVALDEGLLVPVIRDADELSLHGIARAVNDLAERARTRRLRPDDTQEGTFTVTNHGVWGSLFATPVINQPQSGILGVGAIQKRVVVVSENGLDAFAIRPMCYLSLTFDHRVVDGATADRFLGAVKRVLEQYGSQG